MLPFLRPGYCHVRHDIKAEPNAERCFYLQKALTIHQTLLRSSRLRVQLNVAALAHTFSVRAAQGTRLRTCHGRVRGVRLEVRVNQTPLQPPPPLLTPPPSQLYNVARQRGNYLVGPRNHEERKLGRTVAASRKHRSGLFSMVMAKSGIQYSFAE